MSRVSDQFHIERSLAPHVDATWAETFILELRLLEVPGLHIGAALSEVESHCNESGQSAPEAFGDPAEYASSLRLPAVDDEPLQTVRWLAAVPVEVAGMLLVNFGFGCWLAGRRMDITTGHLVIVAIIFLSSVLFTRFGYPVVRGAFYAPWRTSIALALCFMANVTACVATFLLLDEVIWSVPPGWAMTVGVALLAAGTWREFAMRSRDDTITSPFDKPDSSASDDKPGRLATLLESHLGTMITMAMIPAFTVISVATTFALHQLGSR